MFFFSPSFLFTFVQESCFLPLFFLFYFHSYFPLFFITVPAIFLFSLSPLSFTVLVFCPLVPAFFSLVFHLQNPLCSPLLCLLRSKPPLLCLVQAAPPFNFTCRLLFIAEKTRIFKENKSGESGRNGESRRILMEISAPYLR